MSLGVWHTLVLTITGVVYTWGWNLWGQIGNGMSDVNEYQSTPFKLDAFGGEKIKWISCGSYHSMALTESGRVYSWGNNYCGQLGIGIKEDSFSPKLVNSIKSIVIQKISCGYKHSLLLSHDGDIYVCGLNRNEELAAGHQNDIWTPKKLRLSEKFIDIASHGNYSICAAISIKIVYYIWGNFKNETVITTPEETKFQSLNDIFEHYFRISYETVEKKVIRFSDDFIQNGQYVKNFFENRKMGEGSYGEVYEVSKKYGVKRNYAIKTIKFTANYKNEFMKELETSPIICELRHENIVKYFDVWLENDFILDDGTKNHIEKFTLYIQMELCDKDLREIIDEIKNDTNLYSNEALTALGYYIASEIFIEILEGVNYLHKQKPPIIHRDLNPWNILLKIDKQSKSFVKIADLGLATIHEHTNQSHTKDRGNHKYLAPEAETSTKYDTRADIYSLGIISRELFVIDVNGDYEIQSEEHPESFFIKKYKKICYLCDRMTRTMVKKRPEDIGGILKDKNLWALGVEDFDFKEEAEKVFHSNNGNDSFVIEFLKTSS